MAPEHGSRRSEVKRIYLDYASAEQQGCWAVDRDGLMVDIQVTGAFMRHIVVLPGHPIPRRIDVAWMGADEREVITRGPTGL